MTVETDLFGRLSTQAAILTAVGAKHTGGSVAKVFNGRVPPREAKPYLRCQRIQQENDHDYSGAIALCKTRYRIESWHTSALLAQQLADAVTNVMDGFTGDMGDTYVLGAFIESESDEEQDRGDGSDSQDHMVPVELELHYQRSVPTPS